MARKTIANLEAEIVSIHNEFNEAFKARMKAEEQLTECHDKLDSQFQEMRELHQQNGRLRAVNAKLAAFWENEKRTRVAETTLNTTSNNEIEKLFASCIAEKARADTLQAILNEVLRAKDII